VHFFGSFNDIRGSANFLCDVKVLTAHLWSYIVVSFL